MVTEDIVIAKSKISGLGVFANRNFKEGEVVLSWSPKHLEKEDLDSLTENEKHFVNKTDDKYYLMQSPEKFVNYSCEPNTNTRGFTDVAIKDILKGDEITSNYGKDGLLDFSCQCGSPNCNKNARKPKS